MVGNGISEPSTVCPVDDLPKYLGSTVKNFNKFPGSLGNDTYRKWEDQGIGGLFQNHPKSPKPSKSAAFSEFVQLLDVTAFKKKDSKF